MRLSTIIISTAFVLAGTSTAIPIERENMLVTRFGDSNFLAKVEARAYDKGLELYARGVGLSYVEDTSDLSRGRSEVRSPLQSPSRGRSGVRSPLQSPSRGRSGVRSPLQSSSRGRSGVRSPLQSPSRGRSRTQQPLQQYQTRISPSPHRTRSPSFSHYYPSSGMGSSSSSPYPLSKTGSSSPSSHSSSSGTGPVDPGTISHHRRSLYEPSEISRRNDRPWTRYGYNG